jgi:hypothetical protein
VPAANKQSSLLQMCIQTTPSSTNQQPEHHPQSQTLLAAADGEHTDPASNRCATHTANASGQLWCTAIHSRSLQHSLLLATILHLLTRVMLLLPHALPCGPL